MAGTGMDLWKKQGYEPKKQLKSVLKRNDYEMRAKAPEGPGTNRSMGSNATLKKRSHIIK